VDIISGQKSMNLCPAGQYFTGHNFALQINKWQNVKKKITAYAFDSKMICKAKLCPVRYCPAGHKFIDFCPEIMSTSF
jgi:hypothetical protein